MSKNLTKPFSSLITVYFVGTKICMQHSASTMMTLLEQLSHVINLLLNIFGKLFMTMDTYIKVSAHTMKLLAGSECLFACYQTFN